MKRAIIAIGVIIVVVIGYYVTYNRSEHVTQTLAGLEYRTGTGHNRVAPVILKVNGILSKAINGVKTFQGIIDINGATQPNPDDSRPLTIHFDGKGGFGVMAYGYFANGQPNTHGYGIIFISNGFSKVTILENKTGWEVTNGLTIAAPATDRAQAAVVSNELMKLWLKGHLLK